jgi:hypothetical protein
MPEIEWPSKKPENDAFVGKSRLWIVLAKLSQTGVLGAVRVTAEQFGDTPWGLPRNDTV